MNEPGKATKHSVITSNRAIRDIHQSLKHLQVSSQGTNNLPSQPQHSLENQNQSSFERQLGLSSNSALVESVAGDRRSYPRVASSSKQAFALETIRRDLQFLPSNSSTNWHQNLPSENRPLQKGDFKSSSYTDLHQHYGSHMDRTMGELKSIDQQKLSLILSYGYDEAIATDLLSIYPNQSLEILIDKLNTTPGSRKLSRGAVANSNMQQQQRVTQTQRLFGVTQFAPRSQSVMNLPTNSRTINAPANAAPLPNRYQSYQQTYEPVQPPLLQQQQRPIVPLESPSYQPHPGAYIDSRSGVVMGNDGSGSAFNEQNETPMNWKPPPLEHQSNVSRNYDYKVRDSVTLRKKPERHLRNQQDRWSAEVLHKSDSKRNSMEFSHKPPPPYPGFPKTSLSRISSQEGEFQTTKNTPITVIFDEKNERVNVVGGIPECFEGSTPSSPSSSGQSSPRSSQKDPPPYEFLIPKIPSQPVYSTQPNVMVKPSPQPLIQKQQPNPNIPSIESNLQQKSLSQQVTPPTSFQEPPGAYAVPPVKSKLSDSKFIPISDIQKSSSDHGYSSDRGSPPPYPGAPLRPSLNRASLNIDELESTVGSTSGYGGSISSTGTQETQAESTTSTSPVPDDVERSYSPLPICNNNTYDKTMIIHPKDKKEQVQKQTSVCDEFSTRLKNYTPQAYKFYMEQHVENLLKFHEQRKIRRQQLEAEMTRVGLPQQAREEMRKLLNKKESNYMRLRRAKMDKSMFNKIKVVGVGAFGEVSLVKKKGTNAYYAMKTLKKSEVLRRNQVAHVKAERDILAEADNEWVVKLFYSFQNEQNLYFVMDFIPGGDLMALLIKFGIFDDNLAKFYISELVLAIDSVHKLGFIHRDIKPDNILIDKNGHIKLTDFGLCTGFRWTHDSKYYQPEPEGGGHTRQYSMEPEGGWESLLNDVNCNCKSHRMQYDLLKPLQRRKLRRHMRCQAHSLVGTPNYIAPEVLMRIPYAQQCDWWSVGVIMFEMIIGHPPFLAQSPAETQYKVINWRQILNIPKKRLSKEAEDLIRRLCTDPEERLGKDSADEIKEHSYFNGVHFPTLHQERAPYIPSICNATDTSNFDPVPEAMHESDSEESEEQKNSKVKKDGPEYAFYEFTFRNFFDDGGLVNPNHDFEVHEQAEPVSEPQKTASKRSATKSNTSITVPPKVSATDNSMSEEKTPIYV